MSRTGIEGKHVTNSQGTVNNIPLVTQRRERAPFGMKGAETGEKGNNLRITAAGERVELPGSSTYSAGAEEVLIIETPGDGSWGDAKS